MLFENLKGIKIWFGKCFYSLGMSNYLRDLPENLYDFSCIELIDNNQYLKDMIVFLPSKKITIGEKDWLKFYPKSLSQQVQ